MNAKNWSDFANKLMQQNKINYKIDPKPEHTESIAFKSKQGDVIDAVRIKSPIGHHRQFTENKAIQLKFGESLGNSCSCIEPDAQSKQMSKQGRSNSIIITEEPDQSQNSKQISSLTNLALDHVGLLESLGYLVKYKSSYYPPTIQEVEFFVKSQFESLYKLHINFNLQIKFSEENICKDVQYLGLSAYRNNLHLSEREECVVLIGWLKDMKNIYSNEKLLQENSFVAYRDLELLLSFCISEIMRMNKIQCNERALLVHIVWEQSIILMKELEQKLCNIHSSLEISWNAKMTKTQEKTDLAMKILKEDMNKSSKELKRLSEIKRDQDLQICQLKLELTDFKERGKVLSCIIDHVIAKNIMDLKDYNKKQKKQMTELLRRIKKDRKDFKEMNPDFEDNILGELDVFEY